MAIESPHSDFLTEYHQIDFFALGHSVGRSVREFLFLTPRSRDAPTRERLSMNLSDFCTSPATTVLYAPVIVQPSGAMGFMPTGGESGSSSSGGRGALGQKKAGREKSQKNAMQPHSNQPPAPQPRSRSDTPEGLSSPELLPPEHGRLSHPRDWAFSLGSDDGGGNNDMGDHRASTGSTGGGAGIGGHHRVNAHHNISTFELDGEWFGDADPSVMLQAKVSFSSLSYQPRDILSVRVWPC